MKKSLLSLLAVALLGGSFAKAQEVTDYDKWQIRLRAQGVVPTESSSVPSLGGTIAVSSQLFPELDITYFFTKNFAAELSLSTAKHSMSTENSRTYYSENSKLDLGKVWIAPPTFTLQYHFIPNSTWKPYVGAGVNYTIFHNKTLGTDVSEIKYNNVFGIVAQMGVDVNVSKKWFLNLDVRSIFNQSSKIEQTFKNLEGIEYPGEDYQEDFSPRNIFSKQAEEPVEYPDDYEFNNEPSRLKVNPFLISFGVGFKF